MTISVKGKYGIKAMLDLAMYSYGEKVTVKSIAERQNIPEKFLEQLLSTLRKAGLVKSIRGAFGGYSLSKQPENITVGDVLRALEGDLAPVKCIEQNKGKNKCKRSDICITKYIWMKIKDGVNEVIDSITLKDLIDAYKAYEKDIMDGYIYYI